MTTAHMTANKRSALHRWTRGIAIRLGVLALLGLVLRWSSLLESLAFYMPSREAFATPAGVEDVTFTNGQGMTLHAWFVRASDAAPGEARPAILHVHGNAGNVSHHLAFSQHLAEAGFHVLLFDYRGYGRSDRASLLTRTQLMQDTRAAWEALLARSDVQRDACGVYGVSLGGAFALALAAEDPARVKALCTVSTFTSFADVASEHVPLLGRALIPRGLAGTTSAASLQCPYFIVHGENDEIIPRSHAAALAAAASAASRVRTLIVPGADHNGIMDTQAAQDATSEFFRSVLGP